MGLSGSIPNLFSTISGLTVPTLYEEKGLGYTLRVGAVLCGASFLLSCLFIILDKKARRHDKQLEKNILFIENMTSRSISETVETEESIDNVSMEQYLNLRERKSDSIWKGIRNIEIGFWFFVMDCVITYAMNYTAIVIGTNLLIHKYGFKLAHSGIIITMPYLTSVILSPLLGWWVDKFGKRMNWIFLCGLFNTLSHVIGFLHPECDMCITSTTPFLLYGLQLTIYNTVNWGMISYLVEP